ncbi:MAG: 1,4-dihydroxy-2-naphthoate octaprenyltransferase [Spirochaetales bacterium]|nr:1,4-dihydroxy-2-naphthoate octaprenyltransferase [Spirochaetales bacterium]
MSDFLKAWLYAIRPKTLLLAVVGVGYGVFASLIQGKVDPILTLCCFVVAVALQIVSNLVNDFADYQKGVDSKLKQRCKGLKKDDIITVRSLQIGALLFVGVAIAAGIYPVYRFGLPIIGVGIAAILAAGLYTWGPFPYGYFALGEVFVFLFFGLAATVGTYYLNTGKFELLVLGYGAVPGLLAVLVLQINNIRDIDKDLMAGKRSIANLLGRRAARWLFFFLVVLTISLFVGLVFLANLEKIYLLAGIPLLLLLVISFIIMKNDKVEIFNKVLGISAGVAFMNVFVLISIFFILKMF